MDAAPTFTITLAMVSIMQDDGTNVTYSCESSRNAPFVRFVAPKGGTIATVVFVRGDAVWCNLRLACMRVNRGAWRSATGAHVETDDYVEITIRDDIVSLLSTLEQD
jgi:hypothetical protein